MPIISSERKTMSNKGSTSIVGYIAMLMIAGAALGHGEAPISQGGLQANALAFRDSAYAEPIQSRHVRIEIDGKAYDAVLLESHDAVSDKIRLTF